MLLTYVPGYVASVIEIDVPARGRIAICWHCPGDRLTGFAPTATPSADTANENGPSEAVPSSPAALQTLSCDALFWKNTIDSPVEPALTLTSAVPSARLESCSAPVGWVQMSVTYVWSFVGRSVTSTLPAGTVIGSLHEPTSTLTSLGEPRFALKSPLRPNWNVPVSPDDGTAVLQTSIWPMTAWLV